MAGARIADNKTVAAWWLPVIASATLVPTLAEITAGVNLTCDIEKGSKLPGFTGNKKSTASGSLCEDVDIETITGFTYGAEVNFFKRFATGGAPAADSAHKVGPDPLSYGYWVVREGVPFDTAPAAAQIVDVFYMQAGARVPMRGTGENTLRFMQEFTQSGAAKADVAITA